MSKLLKKERLEEENSYHISQIAGSLGSKKGTLDLNLDNFGAGAIRGTNYVELSTAGDWLATTFRITENMDATVDMVLRISIRERFAATDPAGTYNIGATKTDGTEAVSTTNIANADVWGVSGSPLLQSFDITIANAGIDQGDMVTFYMVTTNNFDAQIFNISIEYTEA